MHINVDIVKFKWIQYSQTEDVPLVGPIQVFHVCSIKIQVCFVKLHFLYLFTNILYLSIFYSISIIVLTSGPAYREIGMLQFFCHFLINMSFFLAPLKSSIFSSQRSNTKFPLPVFHTVLAEYFFLAINTIWYDYFFQQICIDIYLHSTEWAIILINLYIFFFDNRYIYLIKYKLFSDGIKIIEKFWEERNDLGTFVKNVERCDK